ncbi:MAG: DUF4394 domain-containing protein [Solirubrobacteraceae bacterium]|nr:DUF4394 domain-containing protein [Solirubrobacteraceae bacterium]
MRSLAILRTLALAVGLGLAAPAAATAAEQLAGLTEDNQILLFRSDSPGNLQGALAVTGLQSGETLVGLGWLESTGRLYALGSTNRVYVVNPVTGAATPLSNTAFSPPLNGATFAFGIDPTTLQARAYSSTQQNLRISVANGQVAGVDAPYAYDQGDPGAGTTPVLGALAYTTPPTGGGAASMYAIDTDRDALVTSPTLAATVRTIGELGVAAEGPVGLAITSGGTAFAALRPGSGELPRLYTVDLTTGAASPVSTDSRRATIAHRSSSSATADTPVIALTSLGEVPDDTSDPRAVVAVTTNPRARTLISRGLPFTVSCNEACTVSGTLRVGRRNQRAVTGQVLSTAGWVRLTARLDSATKALLRRDATQGFSLRVTVTDAAGNETRITTNGATR